ncbi:hypothetical protein FQN54_000067 [Arachnomyces sp. PD_36]|nr:hypothetical protein FQN54_000067 [Arachnomyces sp. PD_36]
MISSTFNYLVAGIAVLGSTAHGAELTQVTDFGDNPTNVEMYIYVPDNLAPNPALIVAMHYCQGTAEAYFSQTAYPGLADEKGFIVIYPDAPDPGQCWDVHTQETLTHDAGGDSLGIASMVRYAIEEYSVNSTQVSMAGGSSGAMMTQVMAGAYPDLFAAGAAYSGVPYGCFEGDGLWNNACADGQLIKSAEEWGAQVLEGYPDYDGPRPRLQIWHGTADTTLSYQNFIESNKQWSNVFGIENTKNNTDTPSAGITEMIFGDGTQYVAYSAEGVGHGVPDNPDTVMAWFGL